MNSLNINPSSDIEILYYFINNYITLLILYYFSIYFYIILIFNKAFNSVA